MQNYHKVDYNNNNLVLLLWSRIKYSTWSRGIKEYQKFHNFFFFIFVWFDLILLFVDDPR